MPQLLQCYNKGCGQKFDPENNNADACQHHPGEPIFHDAKKKWSCCKKFSTDFSEFLSIKGCTFGKHSDVRPIEPDKPKSCDTSVRASDPVPSTPPAPIPPPPRISAPQPRPATTEPMERLRVEVTPSLKSLLEKMSLISSTASTEQAGQDGDTIKPGTSCKNSGCKATYTGTVADGELCLYHPGMPIFHEGMKYWTCCNRKTSEFDAFMEQIGCATGRHNWTEKAARETNLAISTTSQASCRHDWFQLPGQVTISIYAKASLPESVVVEANRIRLSVRFDFGADKQHFEKTFELFGVVDPAGSLVRMSGTKVEIVLKKGEAMSWPRLECFPPKPPVEGDEDAE